MYGIPKGILPHPYLTVRKDHGRTQPAWRAASSNCQCSRMGSLSNSRASMCGIPVGNSPHPHTRCGRTTAGPNWMEVTLSPKGTMHPEASRQFKVVPRTIYRHTTYITLNDATSQGQGQGQVYVHMAASHPTHHHFHLSFPHRPPSRAK